MTCIVLKFIYSAWVGHKILQHLNITFDWHYIGQKQGGDFANCAASSECMNFERKIVSDEFLLNDEFQLLKARNFIFSLLFQGSCRAYAPSGSRAGCSQQKMKNKDPTELPKNELPKNGLNFKTAAFSLNWLIS